MLLNIMVVLTLAFCFLGWLVVTSAELVMHWIEFSGKIGLTLMMITIQLFSLRTIGQLIEKHQLRVRLKARVETRYVFVFFAT